MFFIDNFDLNSSKSTGGMTGSKRVKDQVGKFHQLKLSILKAKTSRKIKAGFTDKENFGEVIASHVGRFITGSNNDATLELVPKVDLVLDTKSKEVAVASKYLDQVQGTVDDYAKSVSRLTTKKRHVKISFSTAESKGKIWGIDGDQNKQLRQDIAKGIVLSALTGDHDINPGNMLVVHDKEGQARVARIDFGHAFNDLISFRSKAFGGQAYNQNRILDFINRETVNAPFGGNKSKLWRDYKGLVPSEDLASALREMAAAKDTDKGIQSAKAEFQTLISELSKDPLGNAEAIGHVKKSLLVINKNIGGPDEGKDLSAQEVLDKTFVNLSAFYSKGQEQMKNVAELISLQNEIDKSIKEKKEISPEMRQRYETLETLEGIGRGQGSGLNWAKCEAKKSAFKGTLDEYIQNRNRELEGSKSIADKLKTRIAKTVEGIRKNFQKDSLANKETPISVSITSQKSQGIIR